MLTRRLAVWRAAVALGSIMLSTLAFPSQADADTATCQENYNNQLVCTASVPGSSGDQGPGGSAGPAPGGSSGSGPSQFECSASPVTYGMPPPPAGSGAGSYDLVVCAAAGGQEAGMGSVGQNIVWVSNGGPPPPPPPPDPATVAAQAESEISLPSPTLERNPLAFGVVNFPEWLWVDGSIWRPYSTSATACNAGGCVTATATATPQSVYFSTGDGSGVTCPGPGVPYDTSQPDSSQSTYCSHTYLASSFGQPSPDGNPNNDAFPLGATVTWTVSWSASGAASGAGSFGPMTTSASTTLRVEQIESVISGQ